MFSGVDRGVRLTVTEVLLVFWGETYEGPLTPSRARAPEYQPWQSHLTPRLQGRTGVKVG